MKKIDLFRAFAAQTENDGALDGTKAGSLTISGDTILRGGMIDGDVIALWWDSKTVVIGKDDKDSAAIADACESAGLTVMWD